MNDDDAAVTRMARAAVAGQGAIPYLHSATTVAGEPARLRSTRLIVTRAQKLSHGGLYRYHLVYKCFSTERLTSGTSTRKSWHEDIQEPLMGVSVIPLW